LLADAAFENEYGGDKFPNLIAWDRLEGKILALIDEFAQMKKN
jgi:hypothetical protein